MTWLVECYYLMHFWWLWL